VLVEQDPETGASYITLGEGTVSRTVEVSELVMVDLDAAGGVVGIEFAAPPGSSDFTALFERFPAVRDVLDGVELPLPHRIAG